MTTATDFTRKVAEDFQAVQANAEEWAREWRSRGFERYTELGLPDPKSESWRFTSLRGLKSRRFVAPETAGADVDPLLPMEITPHRLVFIDGELADEHSRLEDLPAGVQVIDMPAALREENDILRAHLESTRDSDQSFLSLNTALFRSGCVVSLDEGVQLERPLLLSFRTSGECAVHSRVIVRGAANSRATLLEEHVGSGAGFHNIVVDFELNESARWRHVRVQAEAEDAQHLSHWTARVGDNAELVAYSFVLGGGLVRNEMELELRGEHSLGELHGLVVAAGKQLVDHHTRIEHAVPHTTSIERFRHVLDDSARGVFSGRVDVAQDAQKTDAGQSNHNLLLSDEALMNTMPQLEIHADDVKCSHGATLGRLDENALFYLRARGIGAELARSILIRAFVEELVESLPLPGLRSAVRKRLDLRLPGSSAMEEIA